MKITVNQLRKIIKEEIQRIVSERIEYHPKIGDQEIGYDRALKYVDGVGDENPEATLQKVAKMLKIDALIDTFSINFNDSIESHLIPYPELKLIDVHIKNKSFK